MRRVALALAIMCFIPLLSLRPARGQTRGEEGGVSQQQQADIAAAPSPEALVELARGYVLQRQFAAAMMAIQKAGQLKPELLTDPTPVSPRSWHEFWFTQRAQLMEQRLPKNDAAARVKLARWLHEAGLTSPAAQMLKNALAIDPNLAEAKELADKWNLGAGGPIRIDFTYGVTQPLFMPSVQEENVEILIRRDNVFLVVPVAYTINDPKVNITKMLLKATTEEGRVCAVRGIALLKHAASSGYQSQDSRAFVLPRLEWPDSSQPLYERVQVQEKSDKSGFELICYNQTPPIPRPQVRAPGSREPVTPAQRPTLPPGGAKDTREPTGYAAFLIEVPQSIKAVNLELRGSPPLRVEAPFLAAMSISRETPAAQRGPAIAILLAATQSKDGPIAAGAVAKLASLRFSDAQPGQQTTGASPLDPALVDRIDAALLATLAHPDGPARQMAFDVTLRRPGEPPETLLQQIRTFKDPKVLLAMLDAIEQLIKQPQMPTDSQTPAPSPPPPGTADMPGTLRPSSAPPALFAAMTACLANPDAKVRERVIDLLLAEGSRESVQALATATGVARDAVAARLGGISNEELKAAIVRAFLAKGDSMTATRLLQGAGSMSFTITSDQDPLLTGLTPAASPQSLELLLQALARADLSAVASSQNFRQSLEQITTTHQKEAGIRKALLDLALGQLERLPYEAPLKRQQMTYGGVQTSSAFEGVLAMLAATGSDEKIAQAAAVALVKAGRIDMLGERLSQADPRRRRLIIETLGRERELFEREALPAFLAARLSDNDVEVVRAAAAALALGRQRLDAKRRWRFNLGIKQRIELRQLLDLASSSDEMVARTAIDLLASMANLPTKDEADFKANMDRSSRDQRINELEQQRQSRPGGAYMAMIYLDLRPVDNLAGGVTRGLGAAALRTNVPLKALEASMQTSGNTPRVTVDGSDLTMFAASPGGGAPSGTPRINAGLLLRGALMSADPSQEPLAVQVDLTPLNEPRPCDLRYEQFGTWSCDLTIQDTGQAVEGRTFKLAGARIIFEPLPPR